MCYLDKKTIGVAFNKIDKVKYAEDLHKDLEITRSNLILTCNSVILDLTALISWLRKTR